MKLLKTKALKMPFFYLLLSLFLVQCKSEVEEIKTEPKIQQNFIVLPNGKKIFNFIAPNPSLGIVSPNSNSLFGFTYTTNKLLDFFKKRTGYNNYVATVKVTYKIFERKGDRIWSYTETEVYSSTFLKKYTFSLWKEGRFDDGTVPAINEKPTNGKYYDYLSIKIPTEIITQTSKYKSQEPKFYSRTKIEMVQIDKEFIHGGPKVDIFDYPGSKGYGQAVESPNMIVR